MGRADHEGLCLPGHGIRLSPKGLRSPRRVLSRVKCEVANLGSLRPWSIQQAEAQRGLRLGEESPWRKKEQELSVPGHSPQESLGLPGSPRKWGQGEGQDSGDRRVTGKCQVRREMETRHLGCQQATRYSEGLWPQSWGEGSLDELGGWRVAAALKKW